MPEQTCPLAITVVVNTVTAAALQLTTTAPYHTHYHNPVYFVLTFVDGVVTYTVIAVFLDIEFYIAATVFDGVD
jgi:hypothetical protein